MNFVLQIGGKVYKIPARGLVIGRGADNAVSLNDVQVSHHHVRIWSHHGHVYIRDLGSTNGTFINGMQISGSQMLRPGDHIQIGQTKAKLMRSGERANVSSNSPSALVLVLMIGALILVGGITLLIGVRRSTNTPPPTYTVIEAVMDTPTPQQSLDKVRLATVRVSAFDVAGRQVSSGSGSVVDRRGYILTNAHVVEGAAVIIIAMNSLDPNAAPRPAYQADLLAQDSSLDLAVLNIVADENGNVLSSSLDLPVVLLGDSDALKIGDEIIILGYPDVGGDTLTLTKGTVAGFHEDNLGHERGWIKTDAEIAPGNSGGMAIDKAGLLIGVPTFVAADTRTLGRIGGLRPINLAEALLNQMP